MPIPSLSHGTLLHAGSWLSVQKDMRALAHGVATGIEELKQCMREQGDRIIAEVQDIVKRQALQQNLDRMHEKFEVVCRIVTSSRGNAGTALCLANM